MKKNDIVKLAIVAIAAGLCISGQRPDRETSEIAMAKCSRTTSDGEREERPSDCENNTSELDQDSMRKSAARRVVEGTSNTTVNGKRKSAAQRAMEG